MARKRIHLADRGDDCYDGFEEQTRTNLAEAGRMETILMVTLILSSLVLSVGLGALVIAGFLGLVTRFVAKQPLPRS
ncbi:MAG TPA: hypothetical protein VE404_03505 [Verrucomicrobiae bacterium]|nr:hypothetical protein [Verrucomicrobiae bacterium]